jgi:hypothetical protein
MRKVINTIFDLLFLTSQVLADNDQIQLLFLTSSHTENELESALKNTEWSGVRFPITSTFRQI